MGKASISGLLLFLCSLPVSASITAPSTVISGTSFQISWTDVGNTCSNANNTYRIVEKKPNNSSTTYYSSSTKKYYNFIPATAGTYNYKLYTQHCNSSGTYYTYRAEANVTVSPANLGTIIAFAYDELGRMRAVSDSLNGDRAYDYDDAGNRKTVIVSSVGNRPPIAQNDFISVRPLYTPFILRPLLNDSDPDGDPLTISSFDTSGLGVASARLTGDAFEIVGVYPSSGSFKYTISDGRGGFSTATIYVSASQ